MFCPLAIPMYLGRAEEGTVLTFYTRVDIANNNQLSTSAFKVRHLFTGQQWYPELGLYDLRNRFYSPDLGRFLQPDPVGFWGGRNLYRYCRNNPVMRSDPFGTCGGGLPPCLPEKGDNENVPTVEPVIVPGEDPNPADISRTGFLPGDLAGWPTPLDPERVALIIDHGDKGGMEVILRNDSPSVEHPPPSSVPPQNPPPPGPAPATPTSPSAPASPPSPSAPAAGVFSLWQVMLITAFNDPVGDRDNRLGPGSIATADLRYRTSDFDQHGNLVHFRPGSPIRAYRRGSAVTIYRQDGSVYNGTITDTGAGFAAPRPQMGLPNGVPGTLWLDMWTPTGSEDPEWDLVLIQLQP